MGEVLTEIMPIIINGLLGILIVLLGIAVSKVRNYLDEKGITEQIAQYSFLAEIAVKAAEKIYGPGLGVEKKEKAIEFLVEALDGFGIELTAKEIDMFIEAAVEEMQEAWHGTAEEFEDLEQTSLGGE